MGVVQFQNTRRLLDRSALLESILERQEQDMLMLSRKRVVFNRNADCLTILLIYIVTGENPEIFVREPGGQDATKTNTVLLLDQNFGFLAFGSKALDAYYEDNQDGAHLLIEKFKMGLHHNEDEGEPQATALNGRICAFCGVVVLNHLDLSLDLKF
jgi:hypothetical protein